MLHRLAAEFADEGVGVDEPAFTNLVARLNSDRAFFGRSRRAEMKSRSFTAEESTARLRGEPSLSPARR